MNLEVQHELEGSEKYTSTLAELTNNLHEEPTAEETTEAPLGQPVTKSEPWPTLADEALHGIAGEIVKAIDPYTEADQVAVLLNVLTAFGNCLNAAAHARVQVHFNSSKKAGHA